MGLVCNSTEPSATGKVPSAARGVTAAQGRPGSAVESTMRRVRLSRFPARRFRQTWWRAARRAGRSRRIQCRGAGADSTDTRVRNSGDGTGGDGGAGGAGGPAEGGGLFNIGTASLQGSANTFDSNFALGNLGGNGGAGGAGTGSRGSNGLSGSGGGTARRRSGWSRWPRRSGRRRLGRRHLQCRRRVVDQYGRGSLSRRTRPMGVTAATAEPPAAATVAREEPATTEAKAAWGASVRPAPAERGNLGGNGSGGGIFNAMGGTVVIRPP